MRLVTKPNNQTTKQPNNQTTKQIEEMKNNTLQKVALTTISGLSFCGSAQAVSVAVSEDGYINAFGSQLPVVQGGGTSGNLNVRTPNGSGAFQYNNLSLFGFDTTGVDLTQAASATVNISFLSGANYVGDTLRLYILADNGGTDSFDETTLTFNSAIADFGIVRGNALTGQRVPGEFMEVTAGAVGSTLSFNLSAAALTSLQGSGGNNFVTFVAESRVQDNNPIWQLASKEEGVLAPASLEITLVPEPSSSALLGLGGLALIMRRRK